MIRLISAAALAATLAVPAHALQAEQRVLKEVTVTQADGTEKKKYVEADLVTPGDTVVYAVVFRNEKSEPADDVVLVMPVPEEVRLIENSVSGRMATTEFSADGGTTFARREDLRVQHSDGTLRPAAANDITHVRWTMQQAVAPGAGGQLWYRAVLE